jgi:GAF domain-containing protein
VDLDNCEAEPIHVPGSIQPHGFCLGVSPETRRVEVASMNLEDWVGAHVADALDQPLATVLPGALGAVDDLLDGGRRSKVELERVTVRGRPLVLSAHRVEGLVLIEGEEPGSDAGEAGWRAREGARALQEAATVVDAARTIAHLVRGLTGFDRVMVYRFDPEWNGEVIAEDRRQDLNPFLGLHYPASDIPAQARELYRTSWVRLIPDVAYDPVPLLPPVSHADPTPLDLGHLSLRSVSPIHCEYLANMGVTASMSLSIVIDDRLWGLVACHHYDGPRRVAPARRLAAEAVAELASLRIAECERADERTSFVALSALADDAADRVATSPNGSMADTLVDLEGPILALAEASGFTLVDGERVLRLGRTPDDDALQALARRWPGAEPLFEHDRLGEVVPSLAADGGSLCGVYAVALADDHEQFVAWWRDEVVRSIDWGGDPLNAKLAELEGDTVRLSPRRSFERWRQVVSGRAAPWTPAQKGAARRFARHIGSAMLRQERAAAVVADDLQRTLLPSSLPRPDGWDLTAFYEPAAGGRVGGDWYDAVVLPDGHAYVVLGDITGHGTAAAAEMAQVRNAFRALLVESATPQEALERLDRFVLTLLPGSLATIACARIELATGEVVLSHAGHLPALHLTATGAEFAALARDTLIGVRHVPRKATTLRLAPGDGLVLYSDGLVEVKGEDISVGLDRLQRVADDLRRDPDLSAAGVASRLEVARAFDDVTVLVVRRQDPPR